MYTNFDEMDIEPNSDPAGIRKSSPLLADSVLTKEGKPYEEELQGQLLLRTVPLDDGSIGYVFTCTKNGPLSTWRCHACNFVDSWKNLVKHIDSNWHHESMSKSQHSRSNFSKIERAILDISKGQPLPPGMEDEITGPCQILKTLENFEQPLIGLEFLLELNLAELREPRYLCLLCDKRGDPRSIMVHLTSQSHYLMYLRKYFKGFYSLIDKLPKSNECRGNVSTVTAHLIAKLDEKYGRLQPTATRDDVVNVPEQRAIMLQKLDNGVHFTESPEDKWMEEMLTVEYVQNTHLLLKRFPLKPKNINRERNEDNSKGSMFNKSGKSSSSKKQLRNRNDNENDDNGDVVFVGSKLPPNKHVDRTSEGSSTHSRSIRSSRSPPDYRRRPSSPYYRRHRSRSRSPRGRHRSRSPYYERYRRPVPSRGSFSKSSYRRRTPERYYRRSSTPDMKNIYSSKFRGRSKTPPYKHRERSPPSYKHQRTRSRSRSIPRTIPDAPSSIKSSSMVPGLDQSNTNRSKERMEDKKIAFMNELKEVEDSLTKEMEEYSETPENHPAYQNEWKKFWSSRFKELQDEGKVDPHKYDYKPDWINFWNVRVKELFREELNKRKKILKLKYGLSEEERNSKATSVKLTENLGVSKPPGEEKKKEPVTDIKTMWKELTGFEIKEDTNKKRLSPWEVDNDEEEGSKKSPRHVIDNGAQPISPEPLSSISDSERSDRSRSPPPRHSRSRSISRPRSRSISRSRSRSVSRPRSYSKERIPVYKEEYHSRKPNKKIHFENPLNIITVLRQLSVLEFQLGSYASHAINLLSSGLAMEKLKPQSSVDLLTRDNVMFLELVKEKLKGQLLAGVVPKAMVKATLFCIKNIEELLLLMPKLKPTVPPPVPAPPPALLYGAGVDLPPAQPYPPHMYGGYRMPGPGFKTSMGPKYYDKKHERFPFRKSPPKRATDVPLEYLRETSPDRYSRPPERPHQPFSSGENRFPFDESPKKPPLTVNVPPPSSAMVGSHIATANAAASSAFASQEDVVIDKMMVARQIVEVLTAQGRTDVSDEELQALVNTVVENLKEEQKTNAAGAPGQSFSSKAFDILLTEKKDPEHVAQSYSVSAPPPSVIPSAVSGFPLSAAALTSTSGPTNDFMTIPAGFNLNEVDNSTLALLQDAFSNVSATTNAFPNNKNLPIDQLPESELIQLLRNFKSIPRPKQEKLIEFLRKLEDTDPDRVEELKKYVNVL